MWVQVGSKKFDGPQSSLYVKALMTMNLNRLVELHAKENPFINTYSLTPNAVQQLAKLASQGQRTLSKGQYYWGFRAVKLGTPTKKTHNPGRAILQGPYTSKEDAESSRTLEAKNWHATISEVFQANSKAEAQSMVENLTPLE